MSSDQETFDPYYKWLGIPPAEQPPNHYRLLGIERFESDPDVIEAAADRQMSFLRQYGSGPQSDLSQQLLNEVAAARRVLMVAEKREAYDAELRRELGIGPSASVELNLDENAGLVGMGGSEVAEEEPKETSRVKDGVFEQGESDGSTYEIEKERKIKADKAHERNVAKMVQAQARVDRLENENRIDDAHALLDQMIAVDDPKLAKFVEWAEQRKETLGLDPEEMRERAASLERLGAQLIEKYDFEQAIEMLEAVPVAYRSKKFQRLLNIATESHEEVEQLNRELVEADSANEVDESLLPTIERMLEIKPVHRLARELFESLTGKSADRFIPRKKRKKKKSKGAPAVPVKGLVIAAVVVLVVGYGGWTIFSAISDYMQHRAEIAELGRLRLNLNESLQQEIAEGKVQVFIDDEEIPPEKVDDDLPLEPGEHTLVVKKDGKVIHTEKLVVPDEETAEVQLAMEDGKIDAAVAVALSEDPLEVPAGTDPEIHVLKPSEGKQQSYPMRLSLADNGRYLVSGDALGKLTMWDLSNGSPLRTLRPGRRAGAFTIAPDGRSLAAVDDNPAVQLFDLETGKPKGKFEGPVQQATALAFSPDGGTLLAFSRDTLFAWNVKSRKEHWKAEAIGVRIAGLSYSPDGKSILVGIDGAVAMLDAETGERRYTLDADWPAQFAAEGLVVGRSHGTEPLAWAADTGGEFARLSKVPNDRIIAFDEAAQLVAAPMTAARVTQTIGIWEAGTGTELAKLEGHGKPVTCLAFTGDGKYLVSGSQDGTVRFWRVPVKTEATIKPTVLVADGEIGLRRRISFAGTSPAASGDGKRIAVVNNGVAKVFDAATGSLLFNTQPHYATRVVLSPDGRYLGTSSKSTLRFWDVNSRESVLRVPVPGVVQHFELSADNRSACCLLKMDANGRTRVASVIDLESGSERARVRVSAGPGSAVAFSANAKRVAVASGATVSVHETDGAGTPAEHTFIAPGDQPTPVEWLAFTPDGTRVAAACADRTLRTWTVGSDDEDGQLRIGADVVSVVTDDDGGRVAVVTDELKILDMEAERVAAPFGKAAYPIQGAAVVPGANAIVLAADDGTLEVLGLPDGGDGEPYRAASEVASHEFDPDNADVGTLQRIDAHPSYVSDVRFTFDGSDFVSVSAGDRTIRSWGTRTGVSVNELQTAESGLSKLACGPSLVVVGKSTGEFVEWNIATGKESKWAEKLDWPISSMGMATDGSWLVATAQDSRNYRVVVARFDTATGQRTWAVERGGRTAGRVVVSGDGSTVVAELDGAIATLDPADGSVRRWFDGSTLGDVSHDGSVLVTADGPVVRVWDAASGRETRRLAGYEANVTQMALAPDGSVLVTSDYYGTEVRAWHVPAGRQIAVLAGERAKDVTCLDFGTRADTVVFGERSGTIGLWTLNVPAQFGEPAVPPLATPGLPTESGAVRVTNLVGTLPVDLDVSPDGNGFVVSAGSAAKVFDLKSERMLFKTGTHERQLTSAEVSKDGSTVVTATAYELTAWDVATGAQKSRIALSYPSNVKVTPDGQLAIAVGGGDGRRTKPFAAVYDLETGKEKLKFSAGERRDYAGAALSPDGKTYAVFVGPAIYRFDVESGNESKVLNGHETPRRRTGVGARLAYSSDGKSLYSIGIDATLRAWDTTTDEPQDVFTIKYGLLPVALSETGRVAVVRGENLELLIPEEAEVEPDPRSKPPANPPAKSLGAVGTVNGRVSRARFVGDSHLVVLETDGTVRTWKLPDAEADAAE